MLCILFRIVSLKGVPRFWNGVNQWYVLRRDVFLGKNNRRSEKYWGVKRRLYLDFVYYSRSADYDIVIIVSNYWKAYYIISNDYIYQHKDEFYQKWNNQKNDLFIFLIKIKQLEEDWSVLNGWWKRFEHFAIVNIINYHDIEDVMNSRHNEN